MKNYVQSEVTITVTAPATVLSGALVVVAGIVGIAQADAAEGDPVAIVRKGVFKIDKASGFAPTAGAPALYDDGDAELKTDGGRVLGIYAEAAGSSATTALVILGAELGAAQRHVERVFVMPKANSAVAVAVKAQFDGTLMGLSYYTGAKPTSAAGTVLATVTQGGTTQLSTANVDAEGLTEDAETAMTLSATAADLVVDKGDITLFTCTSNHADLVPGEGITFFAVYTRG